MSTVYISTFIQNILNEITLLLESLKILKNLNGTSLVNYHESVFGVLCYLFIYLSVCVFINLIFGPSISDDEFCIVNLDLL